VNPFDILIFIILSFCLIRGGFRGLIKEVSSVIGVIAGGYAAYTYYPDVDLLLEKSISDPAYLSMISIVLIFGLVFIVINVIGIVIKHIMKISHLGWLDHVVGAVFGLIKGYLVSIFLMIAFVAFLPDDLPTIEKSKLSPYLNIAAEQMSKVASKDIRDKFSLNIQDIKKVWEDHK
jgi:membrane protein required for colicin V production